MTAAPETVNLFLERFNALQRRKSAEPAWLRQRRERAMERFLALGTPTARDEEYKYTDLSPLADGKLLFAAKPGAVEPAIPAYASGGCTLSPGASGLATFGNWHLADGVRVDSISHALQHDREDWAKHLAATAPCEDHALGAANTAFFEDGFVVEAAPGAVMEEPIHLIFGDGPGARHPRVVIVAKRNSSIRVVETYAGSGAYWRNAVTEIHAEGNARVDHYRAQSESLDAYHTGLLQATQERDSYVSTFSLSFGAAMTRNDIQTRLNGTGCECSLDGLYAVRDTQHVDHHTAIDHAMPHCNSHQLYKGVLDGRAKGVFNGKIFVRRDAQKTDAVQSNKNLLLSDAAEVNTKPQLEIDANDVRCTHGATIGQLDETAAFYLRARGISAAQARNILTYAFAADALERVRDEPLRKHFQALLLERFAPERS